MSGLISWMMPREDKFFDMFARQAGLMVEAADALGRLLEGDAESYDRIRAIETAADDVTRGVMHAVRRSFITPFDRGAITSLISAMDDAVDEIWHTAKTVGIYRARRFEPPMRQSAELAAQAARLVAEALPLLRNIGRHGARLHELTEAIVRIETQADTLHDEGLTALFDRHGDKEPMVLAVCQISSTASSIAEVTAVIALRSNGVMKERRTARKTSRVTSSAAVSTSRMRLRPACVSPPPTRSTSPSAAATSSAAWRSKRSKNLSSRGNILVISPAISQIPVCDGGAAGLKLGRRIGRPCDAAVTVRLQSDDSSHDGSSA